MIEDTRKGGREELDHDTKIWDGVVPYWDRCGLFDHYSRVAVVVDAHKTVYCAGELPYTPLTGYVMVPKTFDVRAEMRMEFQK